MQTNNIARNLSDLRTMYEVDQTAYEFNKALVDQFVYSDKDGYCMPLSEYELGLRGLVRTQYGADVSRLSLVGYESDSRTGYYALEYNSDEIEIGQPVYIYNPTIRNEINADTGKMGTLEFESDGTRLQKSFCYVHTPLDLTEIYRPEFKANDDSSDNTLYYAESPLDLSIVEGNREIYDPDVSEISESEQESDDEFERSVPDAYNSDRAADRLLHDCQDELERSERDAYNSDRADRLLHDCIDDEADKQVIDSENSKALQDLVNDVSDKADRLLHDCIEEETDKQVIDSENSKALQDLVNDERDKDAQEIDEIANDCSSRQHYDGYQDHNSINDNFDGSSYRLVSDFETVEDFNGISCRLVYDSDKVDEQLKYVTDHSHRLISKRQKTDTYHNGRAEKFVSDFDLLETGGQDTDSYSDADER